MPVTRRQFAPAAASLAALAASPAFGQQTNENVKWRLTSSFPKSLDTLYGAALTIARVTGEMTDGKFTLQPFGAGEIVPGLQVLDAVANNTVECGQTYTGYYIGKNPSFIFDGSVPFGLTPRMHNAWMMYGDGRKLMDEVYDSFGVVALPCGQTGGQMFGWFRKELKTPADFVGLKMRTAGFGGKVMAKLGAVPQQIAGGDIYPALEKGTIDAAEWIGPYDDEKLGFFKVAKNYYGPGWWEPGTSLQFFVNKKEWDKLPKEYQSAFQVAAAEANVTMLAEYDHKNPIALSKLLQNGVKLRSFSKEIMDSANKAALQIYSDESAKNPAFKKLYDSYSRYAKTQRAWFSVAEMPMDLYSQSHGK